MAGGWASALGAAILGAGRGYDDATERLRLRKQQEFENKRQLAGDERAAEMQSINAAILRHQMAQQPVEEARQRTAAMLQLSPELAFNNPAFVQDMQTAGTPLQTKPKPDFLDSVKVNQYLGPMSAGANQFPGPGGDGVRPIAPPTVKDDSRAAYADREGIAPDTGAILPPELAAKTSALRKQVAAQATLTNSNDPRAKLTALYHQAYGTNPPAEMLKDGDAADISVQKITNGMTGETSIVLVNKRTKQVTPVSGGGGGTASGPGNPTATGDAVLQGLDPKTTAIVKQLAQYKYPLPSAFAIAKSPYWQNILSLVPSYDPTWTASDYANRQKLMANYSSGPRAQIATSIDQVIHHLQTLQQAGKNLGNVNFSQTVNSVKNAVGKEFGATAPGNASLAAQAVASELAKIYKGTGSTNVKEIDDWFKSLDFNSMTPDQQNNAVQTAVQLLNGALTAHRDTFERGMGKPMDFSLISPKQQQFIDQFSKPSYEAPQGPQQPGRPKIISITPIP